MEILEKNPSVGDAKHQRRLDATPFVKVSRAYSSSAGIQIVLR